MKVFEKINELKGTNATEKQIADWAYMNRICPIDFEDGLELDCEYPKELSEIAHKCCHNEDCSIGCTEQFLQSDI